ncbi:hypothetical protein SELMODRAFT_428490 [Selaginella moellendorffii]|uniref:Bromo domain-containing protein n=1 Tax=Selaginella moellendorffii TaxID=88036 RepID=D8T309_SELML|nr:ATPase family AAA domain-containing protein At1g05910 [Selaginella moellendorffii]EFJ08946.1 hypothetical protein SELMODRAFT_428490 [Selaginella moellendorffii]|eukprot:XP_002989933.1 ATPase family AAA domain-containing protein At1g05910 [Selaginella moellendorffii]
MPMEGNEAAAATGDGGISARSSGSSHSSSDSATPNRRRKRAFLGSKSVASDAAVSDLPLALTRPVRNARLRNYYPDYSIYSGMPARRAKARAKSSKNRGSMKQRLAKMLKPRHSNIDGGGHHLRRSTRNRRMSVLYDDYSDEEDEEEIVRSYRSKSDEHANSTKKSSGSIAAPRREGLRPRNSSQRFERQRVVESSQESADDHETSDEDAEEGEDGEEDDDLESGEEEDEGEDGVAGEQEKEVEAAGGDEDGEEEEEEEEEELEERDGKRRYELRARTETQRSPPKGDVTTPQKVFLAETEKKRSREGGRSASRPLKRRRREEDSDDSLLVDEMEQGPGFFGARGGARGPHPFLPPTLDMHGSTNWGLGVAASGWGHQGDFLGLGLANTGTQTAGASSKGGADIQPVQVDDTVSFDQVGGLSHYIDSLKEMVFFPLLYPKFFESYHITPPRGVLLCGPPGTGKTLVARALASAAARAGQKVNFYMRKGADVLSKWVGEAERQLRMLFEEAQRCQPSIIFFDEIDGLAPVRSSKSEQIHNSIVSTLLALMDGLDSRGQVVVIGATNRIDAIDGALRRPGRFDREFVFPLPDSGARAEILDIHTKSWHRRPSTELRDELAAACVGYCGADLKALCTEAAIRAFRQRYPQVYTSDEQFVIDADSIRVQKSHFYEAMSAITPAAHRGTLVHSRPLPPMLVPCLNGQLQTVVAALSDIFPLLSNPDGDESSENLTRLFGTHTGMIFPTVYKPRYLLCGTDSSGLDHLGPALLHKLERFPVHSLGLPSLLSDPSAKTPEEALVHIFGEARRNTPSILYLPHFDSWWETAQEQLRTVLLMLLADLPSNLPLLLLGTSSARKSELDDEACSVFGRHIYEVQVPTRDERDAFFTQVIKSLFTLSSEEETTKPKKNAELPVLPKVPKVDKGPSEAELKAQAEAEEHAIRRLRMCLRDVCNRLLYEKRFNIFHFPVEAEEVPDYHTIVKTPMDVATLLLRVDKGHYRTRGAFMQDVELIPASAKKYHGEDYSNHTAARIVSRACALRDAVQGMLSQMDPELVAYCDRIASQSQSGSAAAAAAPPDEASKRPDNNPATPPEPQRSSARLRGIQPDLNLPANGNGDEAGPGGGEEEALPSNHTEEADEEEENEEKPTPSPMDGGDRKDGEQDDEQQGEGEGQWQYGVGEDKIKAVKAKLLLHSEAFTVSELEMLYARLCGRIRQQRRGHLTRSAILQSLQVFVEEEIATAATATAAAAASPPLVATFRDHTHS